MWDTIKELLQTRGAQLLSRYVGIGLVFVAGKVGVVFEGSQLESLSSGLTLLITGAVLFGIDHWIHKKTNETK